MPLTDRPTLNFGNLPLLRAEFSFQFDAARAPSFDELAMMRSALCEHLPTVSDFSGPVGPVQLSFGPGFGIGLDNIASGVGLAFREKQLMVAWQRLHPDVIYPRYEALSNIAEIALNHIGARQIQSVYGLYANQVPDADGDVRDLLQAKVFGTLPGDGTVSRDVRSRWEQPDGEFLLNVFEVPGGPIIETRFETNHTDNSVKAMNVVHDRLIEHFSKILTEHAKNIWELKLS